MTLDSGGAITGATTLTSTGSFEMHKGYVNAALTGNGIVLNKTTAGTVIFTASNSYTGGTNVNAGTLVIAYTGSIAGAVNVNAGGTFATQTGDSHNILGLNGRDNYNTIALNGGTVLAQGDNTGWGGVVSVTGGNVIHTFLSTGASSLYVPTASTASVLVVAGGGGGGGGYGGGGGAGGLIYNSGYSLTSGTVSITVGGGGTGGAFTPASGALTAATQPSAH